MHCDFSKDELEELAFAVMDRRIAARKALERQGDNPWLKTHLEQKLDPLYTKVYALQQQAEKDS